MSNLNNGHRERQVKGRFRYQCEQRNARCRYCRQLIDYKAPRNHPESFEAAHKQSVKTHPHRAYDPTNFIPSHSKCNRQAQADEFKERPWTPANFG